jgi:hypothetical protein
MMGCTREEMVKAIKELILNAWSWLRMESAQPVRTLGQLPAFVNRDSETISCTA